MQKYVGWDLLAHKGASKTSLDWVSSLVNSIGISKQCFYPNGPKWATNPNGENQTVMWDDGRFGF